MRWAEARLRARLETAEAVETAFLEAGSAGTATTEAEDPERVIVSGYFPADDTLDARLADLRGRLRRLRAAGIAAGGRLTLRPLEEAEWANAWRAYFRPRRVGRRLLVVPAWLEPEPGPGDVVLRVDPGQAFGTGQHPTTRGCLLLLEERVRAGDRVLDWGTGSGILAVAAALLGAGEVVAVDVDPVAVAAAGENSQLNGVAERVETRAGGLEAAGEQPFDLAVANIVADVIAAGAQELAARVRPGGLLITGGVVAAREALPREALLAAGCEELRAVRDGEWVTTLYRRTGHT